MDFVKMHVNYLYCNYLLIVYWIVEQFLWYFTESLNCFFTGLDMKILVRHTPYKNHRSAAGKPKKRCDVTSLASLIRSTPYTRPCLDGG